MVLNTIDANNVGIVSLYDMKGCEMKVIVVSFDSSKALAIPFSTEVFNSIFNARIVNVDRSWDGNIKKINLTDMQKTINIVSELDIRPSEPSVAEKLKIMQAIKDKRQAELDEINKEIESISNS